MQAVRMKTATACILFRVSFSREVGHFPSERWITFVRDNLGHFPSEFPPRNGTRGNKRFPPLEAMPHTQYSDSGLRKPFARRKAVPFGEEPPLSPQSLLNEASHHVQFFSFFRMPEARLYDRD